MKMLNKLFLLATTALILSACGKNNKVGNAANNGNFLVNGQGVFSSGMSTGNSGLDGIINGIPCNTGSGNTRIYLSYSCSNGQCSMGQVNSYTSMAAASLRLGKTPTGDIAIAYYPSATNVHITFLMCQDALFNPNTLNQISISALQILNQNVSSNYGGYGQFIANVLFRVLNPQFGNYVQINAPFSAIQ